MGSINLFSRILFQAWMLTVLALVLCSARAFGVEDRAFDLLQIGTRTLTNATVTTRTADYIFVVHAGGMANYKVSELSEEVREQLGYASALKKVHTNNVATLAKNTLASLQGENVRKLEEQVRAQIPFKFPAIHRPPAAVLYGILAGMLVAYLFLCYCWMLICKKTGNEPGVLVWVPGLQIFPLLRAAGMSPAWFLAFLVPVLNIIAQVFWSVKIVQARGKNGWLAILLILPITNLFALVYLAFSEGAPPKKTERASELMTLETA